MIKSTSCICNSQASFYFSIREFKMYRCRKCTLIFVSPRLNASEIYTNDYFSGAVHGFGFVDYEEDKSASAGYLKMYLKWLSTLGFTKGSNLLDVGAANGFFVNLADQQGFRSAGIELSHDAVLWAKKLGRNVSQADAMDISPKEKFDVITVLDVLEHIYEPHEFISKIKNNLNLGGVILINVPNAGSLFAKLCGKSWHSYVPPEHLFYFNKKSLSTILALNGFEIIKAKNISKTFKLSYIYKTIINSPQISIKLRKFLGFLNPVINSKFGEIRVYLPLFDNLTVIAKVIK